MNLVFKEVNGYSDCYINNDFICSFDAVNIQPKEFKDLSIKEIMDIFNQLRQIGDGMTLHNPKIINKYNLI